MSLLTRHEAERAQRWTVEESVRDRAMQVAQAVAEELGWPVAKLLEGRGDREVWDARHSLYLRLWREGVGIAQIGRALGRDHTTVRHGLMKILGASYEGEVRARWPLAPASYRGKSWAA